jgi:hypothetical protein
VEAKISTGNGLPEVPENQVDKIAVFQKYENPQSKRFRIARNNLGSNEYWRLIFKDI